MAIGTAIGGGVAVVVGAVMAGVGGRRLARAGSQTAWAPIPGGLAFHVWPHLQGVATEGIRIDPFDENAPVQSAQPEKDDRRSPEDRVPGVSSAPLEAEAAGSAPTAAMEQAGEMAKEVAARADRAREAAEARAAAQQERASSMASERQAAAERRAVEMVEARMRKLIARHKELQERLSKRPGRGKCRRPRDGRGGMQGRGSGMHQRPRSGLLGFDG